MATLTPPHTHLPHSLPPFPAPPLHTLVRKSILKKSRGKVMPGFQAALMHFTWAAYGSCFSLPPFSPVIHSVSRRAFLPCCWAELASETVLPCWVTKCRKISAHSPVLEVPAKSRRRGATAYLSTAGAPRRQAVLLHTQQGHQAQEAVNYYFFPPPQGTVRNLSHSQCLRACWECLLFFLGSADRNTPLLLVTHFEN